jgi:hypothetical protein
MIYQVYYQRFFGLLRPGEIKLAWLGFSHRLVQRVAAESLGQVYIQMQGEVWSPQGEARPLIESLHLSHTSMSVGDVARDPHGNYWVCNDIGWLPLRSGQFWPGIQAYLEPPTLWMATEASFQESQPQITRLKITHERDCLPPDAHTVEPCGRVAFSDLVALAKLIEQRLGLAVCIDLGEQFYETEAAR